MLSSLQDLASGLETLLQSHCLVHGDKDIPTSCLLSPDGHGLSYVRADQKEA